MAGNFTPRKKIALDNPKLKLSAINSDNKRASLAVGFVSNNPRLVVYTNVVADATERNKGGQILASLDSVSFEVFLGMIEQAIRMKEAWSDCFETKNYIFPKGQRSERPITQATVYVGRDEDGEIWVSVCSFDKERPRIKFPFGPASDNKGESFFTYKHKDGSTFTKGEVSALYARAWVSLIRNLVAHLHITEYKEPEPRDGNGGGRGGYGGGNGGGNRGGYNNGGGNSGSFDDSSSGGGSSGGDDDFFG
jgi:hypothetical protein